MGRRELTSTFFHQAEDSLDINSTHSNIHSSAARAIMPSRRRSTDESSKYEASALDCIFACGICQSTVPEVYSEGHSHGLNSGDSHQEAAITKIWWIADCSHVFCGKHLEGGGLSLECCIEKDFN